MPAVTPAVEALLLADYHEYAHFLVIEFNGLTVRLTEAGNDLLGVSGETYVGNGSLLDIEDVKNTTDIRVNEVNIRFSLADSTVLALLAANNQIGRPIQLFRAFFQNGVIVPDPVLLNWGEISGYSNSVGTETATVQVKMSSPFADWARKKGRRTTEGSQQIYDPDDRGMEFATQVQIEQRWGGE